MQTRMTRRAIARRLEDRVRRSAVNQVRRHQHWAATCDPDTPEPVHLGFRIEPPERKPGFAYWSSLNNGISRGSIAIRSTPAYAARTRRDGSMWSHANTRSTPSTSASASAARGSLKSKPSVAMRSLRAALIRDRATTTRAASMNGVSFGLTPRSCRNDPIARRSAAPLVQRLSNNPESASTNRSSVAPTSIRPRGAWMVSHPESHRRRASSRSALDARETRRMTQSGTRNDAARHACVPRVNRSPGHTRGCRRPCPHVRH